MVDAWKIDPAGARGVLDGMQTSLDATAAALRSVQGGVAEAAGGAGDVVLEALGAFADQVGSDVDTVTLRLVGGVQGVRGAVAAYDHGDLEMAADFQRAGGNAWRTKDLSYLITNAADLG